MRIRFNYSNGDSNYHGTQRKGEAWNQQTVTGWKLRFIDLIKANGWPLAMTRCKVNWRFIVYRPSGACHYFDVALVRPN